MLASWETGVAQYRIGKGRSPSASSLVMRAHVKDKKDNGETKGPDRVILTPQPNVCTVASEDTGMFSAGSRDGPRRQTSDRNGSSG